MHRLMLMRHGKSDWDASYGADHDRPLAPRGERSARAMGELLRAMGEIPDLVVTSSAVRAEATAELARIAGGWDCPLRVDDNLYGAGPDEVLAIAVEHGDGTERLMLIGHEPTWSLLVRQLTGARAPMKTASVAAIDLAGPSWRDHDGATLAYLLHPRMALGEGA